MRSMYEHVGKRADLAQQLLFILHGGAVKRFHTVATIKDITLAAHQHNTAWLCWLLTAGTASAALLMAALSHDLPEVIWGDLPSPTKKLLNQGDETFTEHESAMLRDNLMEFPLTAAEQEILKLADRMAGMLDCIHERTLGNRYMELPYQRFSGYVQQLLTLDEQHWKVLNALNDLWEDTTKVP